MCELAFYAINRVWQEVATVPGQPLDGLRGHGVRHIYQHAIEVISMTALASRCAASRM